MSNTSEGTPLKVQGRIVWVSGDLFKGRAKTEYGTNVPKLNQAGEQMREYGFGLAIKNPGPSLETIWKVIHEEAYKLFPNRQIPPGFAMKYKNGDTDVDQNGVPYSKREGYAGHLVFACTNAIAIKWFKVENKDNILVNEGIKCGDYVNVQLNIKSHPAVGQGKAGLYLNPQAVQFLGYGAEIINTPSGNDIFGQNAPALPDGASATPIVAQPRAQPPPVITAAPAAPNGSLPPPAAAPAPVGATTPHYAVLPPAHQPAPAPAMLPPTTTGGIPAPQAPPTTGTAALPAAAPPTTAGGMPPIPQ